MATKNLARSVIEGGRWMGREERRISHRKERAEMRAYLYRVRCEPAIADGEPTPHRQQVDKEFRDRLGPLYRFLDSRVGKPWNATLLLIRSRIDTRTTQGRHILFGHILPQIHHRRWFVDDRGILRRRQRSANANRAV